MLVDLVRHAGGHPRRGRQYCVDVALLAVNRPGCGDRRSFAHDIQVAAAPEISESSSALVARHDNVRDVHSHRQRSAFDRGKRCNTGRMGYTRRA